MNASVWAIRRPVPVILLFTVLTILGLYSFPKLSIQELPDFDVPTVTVNLSLPGATPSVLETEATRVLEDSVAGLAGVEHVRSTISEGSSVTTVEFDLDKDPQEAMNDVRDAVGRARGQMPSSLQDPVISRVTVTGNAVLTFAVKSATLSELDRSWLVDHTISKALLAVEGVGKVVRQGGLDREIAITLDPEKLQALGITAAEVSRQLALTHLEVPGGRASVDGSEQSIRAVGLTATAADLASYSLTLSGGRKTRLEDIARVEDTASRRTQMALLDGQPVVSFQVFRAEGHGEVEVAARVREAISRLRAAAPAVTIEEVGDNVTRVHDQYASSMGTLYEGALLAVLVVWLFLRDSRATFVAAMALPLSAIPTFFFMDMLGFSLSALTLLALTLVVGVLVDDAIVEVENIVRHMQMGKAPLQAAKDAATEIGPAVVATTLTLVAVFLPTAFMEGIPGLFFKQFGWTVAIAVLVSLLVARLLTPLMAAFMLKGDKPEHSADGRGMRTYLRALDWALVNPGKTLLLAALFFAGSVALVPLLPKGFVPASTSQTKTQFTVELPPGATIDQTLDVVNTAISRTAGVPEVVRTFATIGTGSAGGLRGGFAAAEVRSAVVTIDLSDAEGSRDHAAVEAELRELLALPGVRVTVGGMGTGEKFSLVLSGDNPVALEAAARAAERDLRALRGVGMVTSTASLTRPEIVVRLDPGRAADLGITAQSVGQTLRVATTGDYDDSLAKLNLPERQLPIRVQLPTHIHSDVELLGQLRVPAKGGSAPLASAAEISMEEGPARIDRLDRSRNVTLSVELAGLPLGEVADEVAALESIRNLPPGVTRQESGDAERMRELMGSFGGAMMLGILCVYVILVLLLHSFVQPVAILSALPLSIGGALGALLLGGFSLSLPALIGLLMLMGIVTKNSILLVDYAVLAMREEGLSIREALRSACHKRARPIVMTTVAMVAGMVPLVLQIGGGDFSFRSPMAAAVIGGLTASTLLSLLVVPAVVLAVSGATDWVRRLPRAIPRQPGPERVSMPSEG